MAWTKTETLSSTPDSLGRKNVVETWSLKDRDGVAVATITKDADDAVSMSVGGVKVYRALLTGDDPPTVNATFENSLGGTVVWTRESSGLYRGTLTGAFPANKVFCSAILGGEVADIAADGSILWAGRTSDNVVTVMTFARSDGNPSSFPSGVTLQIEILVYP